MGKYGVTAIKAIQLLHSNVIDIPRIAWDMASKEILGDGTYAQKKACPRSAFLGLCEEGLVKGIPCGKYTISKKNKAYAIKAVQLLNIDPLLAQSPYELWHKILNGDYKSHNYQMDVVISLWNNNLINSSNKE